MNAPFGPIAGADHYIRVDRARGRFQVDKRAFMDPEVFALERDTIFKRCWLYVGHESEVQKPGQFVSRLVANQAVLFIRGHDDVVRAFHNLCTHRGTLLTTEKCGHAKVFTCPYHGWVFRSNGALADKIAPYGYGPEFNSDGAYNLHPVPRLENYRGFWFMNMNPRAVSLEAYLAGAKEWIDMIVDQMPEGIEVTPGEQEFHVGCNWKSISENQIDSYHGPYLHTSYFRYAASRAQQSAEDQAKGYGGRGVGFGNGHAGFDNGVKTGKPYTDWIPAFGDAAKPLIDANKARIIGQYGEARGREMCERTRNLLIFPNTILNDVLSLSVRTAWPETPTSCRSHIWNLAPVGEDPVLRKIRMENHLTFVGPGGFAHPDDYEMFDRRAMGDAYSPAFWHDYSKGMAPGDESDLRVVVGDQSDEPQARAFWTQWDRILSGEETLDA